MFSETFQKLLYNLRLYHIGLFIFEIVYVILVMKLVQTGCQCDNPNHFEGILI